MRRQKRRSMYYSAHSLTNGTVLAAFPVRKPIPRTIKQEKLRIDEYVVCREWLWAGKELSDVSNENRIRFHDIIATNLNMRRAIREMTCSYLFKLQKDIDDMRTKLTIFSDCSRTENQLLIKFKWRSSILQWPAYCPLVPFG